MIVLFSDHTHLLFEDMDTLSQNDSVYSTVVHCAFNYIIERKANIFDSGIFYTLLSYDVASGSDITLCNKIDKPLVVNRFDVHDNVAYIMIKL